MLESLIERGGYKRNRIKILGALGISPAALSQYVRGETKSSVRVGALSRVQLLKPGSREGEDGEPYGEGTSECHRALREG